MLLSNVWDMKALDSRRKMFALVYIIALGIYALLRHVYYIVLKGLDAEGHLEDSFLLIEVVTATGICMITSRMAQHDATIALVSER